MYSPKRLTTALFFLTFLFTLSSSFAANENQKWLRTLQNKAKKVDGDFYYVSVQDIAETFNINTYYSNKVHKAILYFGVQKITVSAFNPFILVDKYVIQLPISTTYYRGDIYVPIKFFTPVLQQLLSNGATDQFITRSSISSNILSVRVQDKANGTLFRIATEAGFRPKNISTRYSRKWLYIDVLGGRLDPKHIPQKLESTLVKEFIPIQQEEMVQLSFRLNKDISEKEIKTSYGKNEILVSIPGKIDSDLIKRLKEDQEKWRIDRIVIDPGHGGKDPGTIGSRGTYEKDVVLGVAKKLKKLLEKNLDVEVLMTRDDDTFLSLKERTQFANKNQGKLFISIHANWNRNSKVNGAATYFLGLAKSEESLEIAQRENSVIKYEDGNSHFDDITEEQIILATMAQNSYNKESQDFAAMIQEEIHKQTGLRNRGIKQAGFYVMIGASMPNVLVETGFMSNKKEEKLLKKSSFQGKIAQAIYKSIKSFKEKYEWSMASK